MAGSRRTDPRARPWGQHTEQRAGNSASDDLHRPAGAAFLHTEMVRGSNPRSSTWKVSAARGPVPGTSTRPTYASSSLVMRPERPQSHREVGAPKASR